MKTHRTQSAQQGHKGDRRLIANLYPFLILALALLVLVSEAHSATISFDPNGKVVDVAPGQVVAVPVSVSLNGTTLPNYYASFGVIYSGGTLNRSWMSGGGYVTLNSWYKSRDIMLQIKPPVDAAAGSYTLTFSPAWLNSNEKLVATELTLYVNVVAQTACKDVPSFSPIASSADSIETRNNKPVTVELSGNVSVPDGCEVEALRYVLNDEYGELSLEEAVALGADGSFKVGVQMVASRKGSDKDGRHYSIRFIAENESGIGESEDTVFVVTHDNRAK